MAANAPIGGGGRASETSGDMQHNQKTAEERAKSPPPGPCLSEHYKPVGIQAVTAATVCKAAPPPPKRSTVVPEDS